MNKKHTCSCNCTERVKALEKRVEELSVALTHHLSNQPRLLWGWKLIGEYALKSPRTLQRYARLYGFPVTRVSKQVVSSASLVDAWLIARKQQQRARKGQPTHMGEFWRTHPRDETASATKSPTSDAA
jgi:hypothetical protein